MKTPPCIILFGLLLMPVAHVACGRTGASSADAVPPPSEINVMGADGTTPLIRAVRARNLPLVKKLLSAGADPEVADDGGQSALMLTWMVPGQDGIEMTKTLLNADKNLEQADVRGMTALIVSVASGRPDVAKVLLGAGASVTARDKKGETPLFIASSNGYDPALVKLLLDREAEVRTAGKTVPPAVNDNGETALMKASAGGNLAIIRVLIEGVADLEARNQNGETALFYAVALGHPAAAQALIDAGAEVDAAEGQLGNTPLSLYAASVGREDVLKVLLDAGADPTRKNKSGDSAIALAKMQNQTDKLALLEKAAATRPVHRATKH